MTYSWKNGSSNQVTLVVLQNMLHDINPYVQVFQQTGRLLQQNSQNLTMIIADSQCYNVPTTFEIATIIVGDNNNPSNVSNCDIILHSHVMREFYVVYLSYIEHMHYCIMFFFFQEGRWMASNNSNPNPK